MSRIQQLLSLMARFIGRFWPASQDEGELLDDLGAAYGGDADAGEPVIDDGARSAQR